MVQLAKVPEAIHAYVKVVEKQLDLILLRKAVFLVSHHETTSQMSFFNDFIMNAFFFARSSMVTSIMNIYI